ncbi:MAG: hypothetical protein C4321_04630 [Chloroflexota bacterium]
MGADSLLVALMNRGGNKLDQFLDVSADILVVPRGEGAEGVLTVSVTNRVGPGEPTVVAGPTPENPAGYGVYTGILAVTLPGGARMARIDGVGSLAVAGPDGPTRVVGTQVVVAPGATVRRVVRFELPRHGSVRIEPSARVPAVAWVVQGTDLGRPDGAVRARW